MWTRFSIRTILGFCAVAAITAQAFAASEQFATIDGEVRIAGQQQRLSSATVTLLRAGIPIDDRQTDKTGRFRFQFLAPDCYTASVDYSGYQNASVDINLGAPTDYVYIAVELRPAPVVSSSVSPVISVRQYRVPGKARKEFARGRKEMKRGNCLEAIGHLERGLSVFDEDAAAYNDLGNCQRKLGRLDRAEDSLLRAVRLGDSVYFSLNLAEVYVSRKRFNDAEAVLTAAIRKSPAQGDAYYALAALYFEQERITDAETMALRADSRSHRIADLHLLLAKIYLQKKDTGALVEQLKTYLKEAPAGPLREQVRESLRAGR